MNLKATDLLSELDVTLLGLELNRNHEFSLISFIENRYKKPCLKDKH